MPGKGSSTGPKAAMSQAELELLEVEVQAYRPVGQPAVDEPVRTWFRLYHSLVLLAAAIDPPHSHSLNR